MLKKTINIAMDDQQVAVEINIDTLDEGVFEAVSGSIDDVVEILTHKARTTIALQNLDEADLNPKLKAVVALKLRYKANLEFALEDLELCEELIAGKIRASDAGFPEFD